MDSVRHLLVAEQPALDGRLRPALRPPSLTRQAGARPVQTWLGSLSAVVTASVDPVAGLVVHRDADGPDPRGDVAAELTRQLSAVHPQARAAVPVQAMEAWWFLFPDAVRAVRPRAWRSLVLPRGDVEAVGEPKRELERRTRQVAQKQPYAEADSAAIARAVLDLQLAPAFPCASYNRLKAVARELAVAVRQKQDG